MMRRVLLAVMLGAMLVGCASVQGVAQRAVHPCPPSDYSNVIWSPDGSRVAYTVKRPEGEDTFIVNLATESQTHLVDYATGGYPYQWSPDGKQILLWTGDGKLRVINVDGTSLRDILSRNSSMASWSPDSTKVAYIDIDEARTTHQLSLFDLSSSTSTSLYASPAPLAYPVWSPDGSKIAFTMTDSNLATLMVINSDGTGLIPLHHGSTYYMSWSPDSRQIAFSIWSGSGGVTGAYLVNADGTGLIQLTDYPSYSIKWRPDGAGIVAVLETQPFFEFHLSEISVDGTLSLLAMYDGHDATFSPDSMKIAYQSDEFGFDDLYVMNIDGTDKQRLTVNPGYSTCFSWPF